MTASAPKTIQLHENDNVVIALENISAGGLLIDLDASAAVDVMRGHKIAVTDIEKGASIIRYNQVIGQSKSNIAKGDHVHTHNLEMTDHQTDYKHAQNNTPLEPIQSKRRFMGYRREDGGAGTRNYIGILTTVNCSGSVARFIVEAAQKSGMLDGLDNIDGIVPITHNTGCGMASSGEGYNTLFRTLSGYAKHPNFGGILLIGLGCEVMQIAKLADDNKTGLDRNLRSMSIQQLGGTQATINEGLKHIKELLGSANRAKRQPIPAAELMVGMQCGGSDGFSGITANPALGVASDLVVRHGGTMILSETPEIYGAEHLLTSRAATREVGEKLIERVRWWEEYCARTGGEMDNNPSPGNKRGGLTTILEKSLGATAKGGSAPLNEVYKYAEPILTKGFVFMDSPGFDPCSVTGQVASGANLIVFTTGRGSVSGYKPTPCIKLATNDEMYHRLHEDMDINCGDIINAGVSIEEKGNEIFEMLLRIASGEQTKSELLGYGGVEFVPWQIGAVM